LHWLHKEKEFDRLKRMYIESEPYNKLKLIKKISSNNDDFLWKILKMSVNKKEYFREKLPRIIGRYENELSTNLLIRILREGAAIEPEGLKKTKIGYVPCPSRETANILLKRLKAMLYL